MMSHVALALASLALVGVVVAQDFLYSPLRQETISAGLTGPYHWWLDGSYVLLAAALIWATAGCGLAHMLAAVAGVFLILTAATNTFSQFFDGVTHGQHARWHARCTLGVFVFALALEVSLNHGPLWGLTVVNVSVPAALYALSRRSDYTEKVGVLIICLWLVVWAV